MFKYGKFLLVWWCADPFGKESPSSVPLVGITLGFWWQPGLCHALAAPYLVGRYMGWNTRYWQENRGMKMGQWMNVPAEVWVFRLLDSAGIFILQKTGLLWRMCNANQSKKGFKALGGCYCLSTSFCLSSYGREQQALPDLFCKRFVFCYVNDVLSFLFYRPFGCQLLMTNSYTAATVRWLSILLTAAYSCKDSIGIAYIS